MKKTPSKNSTAVEFVPISSGPKVIEKAVEMLQTTISEMMLEDLSVNRDACRTRFGNCPYLDSNLCPNQDNLYSVTLDLKPKFLDKKQSIDTDDGKAKEDSITERSPSRA